jgi:glycosyltransferase involved in cell wall biosynthesis
VGDEENHLEGDWNSVVKPALIASSDDRPRFLAVIGLYRMAIADSASLRTLRAASEELPQELGSLFTLIYDNTPGGQEAPTLPMDIHYHTAGQNDGLAAAFNFALEAAQAERYDWLITLDQDTQLPPDFLTRIAAIAHDLKNERSIAAIAPRILGDGRVLSPNWFWAGAVPRWFPRGYVGVPPHPTFAFNSASVLRVSALLQVQGYSPWFWLDNSDSYLYHRLHLYGKRVFVAGDLEVSHHFSMLDKNRRMSIARYRNALMAESAFWDLSMNRFAGLERTARLVGRWAKHILQHDPRDLRKETEFAIKRRLIQSRRSRVDCWARELELQSPHQIERKSARPETPRKISVCMAACNGEKFIREQLHSVLCQLGSNDEVIVVDDASEDQTRTVIAGCYDHRVHLIRHQSRQGIVSSFEHAIRSASGDVLFLCDQDDIWSPNKVSEVMRVFTERPDVSLVVTNLKVIDESGAIVSDQSVSCRRPFDARVLPNLLSNRFQGSAMAFRSSLIQEVLPFPQGCNVLHDAWIGLRNTVTGGQSYYLEKDLLLYRRHTQNASRPLGIFQKLLKRVRLVAALALRWLSDKQTRNDATLPRAWGVGRRRTPVARLRPSSEVRS